MDLRELETLPASLKNISVNKCNVLQDIRGVRGLKNLEELHINDCEELDGLPCFAELVSLENFTLTGSSKVKKIAGLQELRTLRDLRIELDELPNLANLSSLKIFVLGKCNKLEKIESLKHLKSLEEIRISDCPELEALPNLSEITSLKEFRVLKCHKLEKIEGLESLTSLETLRIHNCLELDRLPSLAELTSLKELDLRMCQKLEKIEGLERLRSLKKLEVHTHRKAPCIGSLKHCERLESLVVVENDRSDVEPFISKIQKWPSEVIMCTRAEFDVGSLKSFFELPNVSVLDYSDVVDLGYCLQLRRPESSVNAILICFIIDCVNSDLVLFYIHPEGRQFYFDTKLREGKWVWMGVFTQASGWLQLNREHIFATTEDNYAAKVKVEEAWLVIGEEGNIKEAFQQLFRK